MNTATLKIKTKIAASVGLRISWDYEGTGFKFVSAIDSGIFDDTECTLQDGVQGTLIISAWNGNKRQLSGEFDFMTLNFDFEDGDENSVDFSVSGQFAKDGNDNDVPVQVLANSFLPAVETTIIELIWN